MQLHSAGYGIFFRILLVKTLVPERCAIFCWQVMKMFHLFLTSGSLKYDLHDIVLWKQMIGAQAPSILASQSTEMYVSRRNALVTIKDTFSGYTCTRKMRHFLLACYEDVPSFLNRSKLKVQPYIVLMAMHNSYHNFYHSLCITKCKV